MRVVDCVSCATDANDLDAGVDLGALNNALLADQWISLTNNDKRLRFCLAKAIDRWVMDHLPKQAPRIDQSKPKVVRYCDGEHARGFPETVKRQLGNAFEYRTVVPAARRGNKHQALDAFRDDASGLDGNDATHRISDECGSVDANYVHKLDHRFSQIRNRKYPFWMNTASISWQVGNKRAVLCGEEICGWKQVRTRNTETMEMDQGRPARVFGVSGRPEVDRQPTADGPLFLQVLVFRRHSPSPSSLRPWL